MFTIFDLLMFLCPVTGIFMLALPGYKHFGIWGAIVGAAIGFYLGFLVGRLPLLLTDASMKRGLKNSTTESLKKQLDTNWPITLWIIGELIRRGEPIESFRGHVIRLLQSDAGDRRNIGWNNARFWFPEIAEKMDGFNPFAASEKCMNFTKNL